MIQWAELHIGDNFIIGPCLAKVWYTVSKGVDFYIVSSVLETLAKLFDGDSSTYCLNTVNTSRVNYTMTYN